MASDHLGSTVRPDPRLRPALRRIAMALVVAWHAGAVMPEDAAPPVPQSQELPAPLSLEAAQAFMIEHNPGIIAARAGVDAARAQQVIAGYRPNPTLSLAAEQFDVRRPLDRLGSDSGGVADRFYTVHVDQLFELGGKRERRLAGAAFQRQAAEVQVLDAIRQTRSALAQAFYGVLLAQENLQVLRENIELAGTTEKLIKDHVESGNKPESDLISFQVSRIQSVQDLDAAQLADDQAWVDLANLLGLDPARLRILPDGSARPLAGRLAVEPVAPSRAELEAAVLGRSDVQVARRTLEAARSAIDLARAQRSVDVDLGVEYQRNGPDNTVGLTASVPIPAYNNHAGEIAQAEAQFRIAQAQLVQAETQARAELDKAWQAHASSRRMLELYNQETLAKARHALEIAKDAYQHGATGLLELLDAQRTYNQIRISANQAQFAFRQSLALLAQASGADVAQPER